MTVRLAVALFFTLLALPAARAETPVIDFHREVRPILAQNCYACHGPDTAQRKAKLRLDTRQGATAPLRGGGFAVVPGKAGESELLVRVTSDDPSARMPPPKTGKRLTPRQIELLRRWVDQGAAWPEHWAFVPPKKASPPNVKQDEWPRNPIDRFVLARLEAAGLRPSPRADRYTLARRVSLDLTGLPPTVAEADAFVNDPAPDAYERLVERLLASPHYGERWARRWLDLARYADTNGYEKDRPRSVWPYRDWVIRALNADLPFDQFTVEQLAGDLLPGATLDQKIATGFHRNTMLNEEGGIDPLEFRFHALTDRVATTATVWLGLTLGCAQCHTHKFDPLSHREYYQFLAFLNNAEEPELEVPRPDVAVRRAELEARSAALTADLPNRFPADGKRSGPEHLQAKFAAWLRDEAARAVRWTALRPVTATSNLPRLTVLDDSSVLADGDLTKRDVYDLTFRTGLRGVTALRLEALPDDRLPQRGPGRVFYEGTFGDFFLSEVTLTAEGRPAPLSRATHSYADGKHTAAAALDGNPQTGWSVKGAVGQAHTAVFNLAAPLADAAELKLRLLFEYYYVVGLGRFRISVTTDARPAEARGLPADLEELLLLPEGQRTTEHRERLFRHYLSVAPELAAEREKIKKLRGQLPAQPTTLVMAERPPDFPRPTRLYRRGEFLQPAEQVEPGVPAVLPPLPAGATRDRLSFARWLVDPVNPLVGRVAVNRQWAALFGRGLVRTLEDFGSQGEAPTHPELLDWLAVELVRQGWSLKQLHRLLVTSATYQQASRVTPELLDNDPQNLLLARGPRFRLEAEQIRDAALRAGGLLAPKVGGPSVFPPQPASVASEGAFGNLVWKVSEGADRYRRGLYTFSKRTAPYAVFNTFDAPSGEACMARREVSNTPLQALTLLNDAVFVEAAQALGRWTAARPAGVEARAADLFRRCLTRPPSAEELATLVRFYRLQKQRLDGKEMNATDLAGPGDGDLNERSAWTAVARALLNLDEAITRN